MNLTIPDPALVLLVGPSGAGKSTFAARHFSATEVVSSDAVREMVSDDAADQDASAEATRKQYTRLAARYGVPAIVIAFDLPLSAYHQRNARRAGRIVDELVVEDQAARIPQALVELESEGYAKLIVLREGDDQAAIDRR